MADKVDIRAGAALLIGIGRYQHADRIAPLPFAVLDAEALAGHLVNPEIGRFAAESVVVLTTETARRDEVVRRLSRWLPEAAHGAEIALVYFAGHGMVRRVGPREEGYLLPFDADPEDLLTRGIAMSDLARWIEEIDAKATVICLDCCHAGRVIPRSTTEDRPSPRDIGIRPAVLRPITGKGPSGKGRFLIAACDDGQYSHEAPQLGHGLFTYHLLRGIAGAGDRDEDGKVGIAELFEYVSEAVERDSREKFGLEQKPWFSAVGAGRFFISSPSRRRDSISGLFTVEGPALEAESTIAEIEREIPSVSADDLIRRLSRLRKLDDPRRIPPIFRCLAHPDPAVRDAAKQAVDDIGWARIAAEIEGLARRLDDERIGFILEGFEAFASHPEVVSLLDRLVVRLHGDSRNRAILLLERKRLVLELEATAAHFREKQGRYRIEKVLGQGLLTAAYLARDEEHELDVVVRVLRPEFVSQPHIRAQFLDLGRKCVHLVHQNLVSTRDTCTFPDQHIYCVIRKYINGITLRKMLESGGRFEPAQVVTILRQVLDGLRPLHEVAIAHGGIKPSNLFVSKKDFVIVGDPSLPAVGMGMAWDRLSYDFRYVPPELFKEGALVPQSDFYALGCVAYELFCGVPPFVSHNSFDLAVAHRSEAVVPPSLRGGTLGRAGDEFIQKLLAKSVADRPADVDKVARALEILRDSLRSRGIPDRTASPLLGGSIDRYEDVQSLVRFGPDAPLPAAPFVPPPDDASPQRAVEVTGLGPLIEGQSDRVPERESAAAQEPPPAEPPPESPPSHGTSSDHASPRKRAKDAVAGTFRRWLTRMLWGEPSAPPPMPPHTPPPASSATVAPATSPSIATLLLEQENRTRVGTTAPGVQDSDMESSDFTIGQVEPGQILFNRYRVERQLGEGGMGAVWLVRHIELDVLRVLKLIVSGIAFDPLARARFKREARVMARLSHPNVVAVYDARMTKDAAFIEMEYVRGQGLNKLLKPGVPMPLDWTARIVEQLCDVLQEAHALKIVHRDLKPANLILVDGRPVGKEQLKVVDFGLAKILSGDHRDSEVLLSQPGMTLGTPTYMSPEQIIADSNWMDARSDLYSVGVILYELLTGHRPFSGGVITRMLYDHLHTPPPSFAERNPSVIIRPEVERVVMRCLAKNPDDRPQSARELAEDFRRSLSH